MSDTSNQACSPPLDSFDCSLVCSIERYLLPTTYHLKPTTYHLQPTHSDRYGSMCDANHTITKTSRLQVLLSTNYHNVPELANLGGKQHPMDIVFSLFPSNFTKAFPISSTENIFATTKRDKIFDLSTYIGTIFRFQFFTLYTYSSN